MTLHSVLWYKNNQVKTKYFFNADKKNGTNGSKTYTYSTI